MTVGKDVNENGAISNNYLAINRPVYRTGTFREKYLKNEEKPPLKERLKTSIKEATTCTPEKRKKCCFSFFPVIKIMKRYKWRTDLPNDLIAGLTVGIMQLPQGMAYSMLADLPPVVGLYMSFFPPLVYFLFGTSKQISMGTVAVVSLMTGGVVSRMTAAWKAEQSGLDGGLLNSTLLNGTMGIEQEQEGLYSEEETKFRIAIAASVGFVAGLAQVLMGFLKVGFVTTYMSDSLVSGFTTGAAVHVFTSQVKYALGISIPRFEGMFQIIKTYASIISTITKTNIPEMVITLICIVIIYLVKVQINQRFKHKLKIPIPVELLVVIGATLASHFGNFHQIYKIRVVGKIPAGMPNPSLNIYNF
ncbi:sulfate transporter [Patella vulgata]|uniref:sulfate transporter n=1 Tax=Patella vulgata TaxID=6465 RepID=UPI00218080AE|nr:sulfate transporter [Patella vulgata]